MGQARQTSNAVGEGRQRMTGESVRGARSESAKRQKSRQAGQLFLAILGIMSESSSRRTRVGQDAFQACSGELRRRVVAFFLVAFTLCGLSGCGNSAQELRPEKPITDVLPAVFTEDDWPCWRGENMDGIARGPAAPLRWSNTENILWAAELPGRGHSSPILVGSRIFLTTADEVKRSQSVVCLSRKTGNPLWTTQVHSGGVDANTHLKNTQATPTPVCDAERVYVVFLYDSRVQLTALDLYGKPLWTRIVGTFVSKFGYSPSPVLYGPLIIVAVDHSGGGYLTGINRVTGEIHWRTPRPAVDSYATPAVHRLRDRDLLLIAGADELAAYDPLTGRKAWGVKGTTEACVGSPVSSGNIALASGGYPGGETLAVNVMENGQSVPLWKRPTKSYVPSLLAYHGSLYQVTDGGVGSCWDIETGRRNWEGRLGGDVSSSPVLSGEHIYLSNEQGVTQVFKASPKKLEIVARNSLGDEQMASPAICDGRIYIRAAKITGETRIESLYCIAEGMKPLPKAASVPPAASSPVSGKPPAEPAK